MIKIISFENKYKDDVIKLISDVKFKELHWLKPAPDIEDIPKNYLFDKGNFWIVVDKEKVIGTIGLQDIGFNRGYLRRMYLRREYRGTGVAKQMLQTLFDFACDKAYKEIYLAATKDAIRAIYLYKKYGFEKIKSLPSDIPHEGDTEYYCKKINESKENYDKNKSFN